MTTPTQPDPSLIQQHEVLALALEAEAAKTVAQPLATAVAGVLAWMHVEYLGLFGTSREERSGLRFQLFTQRLAAKLRTIHHPRPEPMVSYARRARTMGIEQGLKEAGRLTAALADALDAPPARSVLESVDAAVASVEEKLRVAQKLTASLSAGTLDDVSAAVTPAQQAVSDLQRDLTSLVHASLNDGLAAAILETDGRLLWVSERDACATCLALSGQIADNNGAFDWTLTFGAKAYPVKAYDDAGQFVEIDLRRPPRHPRCRCRCTWWYGDRDPGPHDFPTALRREAERSILNGYALESESTAIRLHAAENLLARIGGTSDSRAPSGWAVPTTVQQRARTRLSKGTFTTRPVPNGR